MKEKIPNLLSFSRIVICIVLFFLPVMGTAYQILFVTAFITDILDGYLARRWKVESELGSRLDSFADTIYLLLIVFTILPWINPPLWIFYLAFICAAIKIIPMVSVLAITGKYVTYHNWFSKSAAMALMFMPFGYLWIGLPMVVFVLVLLYLGSIRDVYLGHLYLKNYFAEKAN